MKKSASTESSFTKTEYKLTVLGGGGVGKTGTTADHPLLIMISCSAYTGYQPPPLHPAFTVQMCSSHFVEYYDPNILSDHPTTQPPTFFSFFNLRELGVILDSWPTYRVELPKAGGHRRLRLHARRPRHRWPGGTQRTPQSSTVCRTA